jgi:hypothetical protein
MDISRKPAKEEVADNWLPPERVDFGDSQGICEEFSDYQDFSERSDSAPADSALHVSSRGGDRDASVAPAREGNGFAIAEIGRRSVSSQGGG